VEALVGFDLRRPPGRWPAGLLPAFEIDPGPLRDPFEERFVPSVCRVPTTGDRQEPVMQLRDYVNCWGS
jgi:hypothetical protein